MTTKSVAILFTDIVGSTEMSRRKSPGEADDVRREHLSVLRQATGLQRRDPSWDLLHFGPWRSLSDMADYIDPTASNSTSAGSSATTTTTLPPTTTTTQSPTQYEAACTAQPSYGALTSPNAQSGQCATYQAQIFQYDTNTGPNEMLVDITNDGYGLWTNTVELSIPSSVAAMNFVKGNVIQFWGTTNGEDTYSTSIGGSNTVPVVDVRYASLVSVGNSGNSGNS